MLHNGLYEQIINKGLDSELSVTDKLSQTAPIDSAEASKVLAKYVAEIVEKGLNNVKDNGGDLNSQVDLVNRIVSTIMTETKEADFDTLSVAERAEQLLALFDKKNNVLALDEKVEIIRPETSIAQSSLFTGAIHDREKLRAFYSRADLFLFPSTYDTSGLVVKEAAACDCPSVLVKGSCASEGVEDGVSGFMCDENVDSLYSTIKSAVNDREKLRQVGVNAGNNVYYSWEDAVSAARKRYEEIIAAYKKKRRGIFRR